ncbi:Uncharacterised protein [Vibrio cholerae]|nr:Uncharacterised protein [Vibrio cholerae]
MFLRKVRVSVRVYKSVIPCCKSMDKRLRLGNKWSMQFKVILTRLSQLWLSEQASKLNSL